MKKEYKEFIALIIIELIIFLLSYFNYIDRLLFNILLIAVWPLASAIKIWELRNMKEPNKFKNHLIIVIVGILMMVIDTALWG